MKASELKAGDWFETTTRSGKWRGLCVEPSDECGDVMAYLRGYGFEIQRMNEEQVTPLPLCDSWDWQPEPVAEPQSYAERQAAWVEANGVKVGTRVRVTRAAGLDEDGWINSWPEVMNSLVGKCGDVIASHSVPESGIRVAIGSDHFWFPYFVLEVAEPAPEPHKPNLDLWVDSYAELLGCDARPEAVAAAIQMLQDQEIAITRLLVEQREKQPPAPEPLQVREGKWRRRRGDIAAISPLPFFPNIPNAFRWVSEDGLVYQDDGTCSSFSKESDVDLIAEVTPPQPEKPIGTEVVERLKRFKDQLDTSPLMVTPDSAEVEPKLNEDGARFRYKLWVMPDELPDDADDTYKGRLFIIESDAVIKPGILQCAGLMLDEGLLSNDEVSERLPMAQSYVSFDLEGMTNEEVEAAYAVALADPISDAEVDRLITAAVGEVAPDPGEGWRLIDIDVDEPCDGDQIWDSGKWKYRVCFNDNFNACIYRRRTSPAEPRSVATVQGQIACMLQELADEQNEKIRKPGVANATLYRYWQGSRNAYQLAAKMVRELYTCGVESEAGK